MGGYKAKLKKKFHKLKEKFHSGSKQEERTAFNGDSDEFRSNELIWKELQSVQKNADKPTSKIGNDPVRARMPELPKVIEGGSVMDSYFRNPSFSPMEMQKKDKQQTQAGKIENSWKTALPTLNQKIATAMATNAAFTQLELQGVENEEAERFITSHQNVNIDSYKQYSANRSYTIMNNMARGLEQKPIKTGKDIALPVTEKDEKKAADALIDISKDMEGPRSRLEKDRTVYRGVGSNYINTLRKQLGIGDKVQGEELNRRLKGAIIFDKAFTSTSLDPNTAEYFAQQNIDKQSKEKNAMIFQIHAPKGLKAQYIAPISRYKEEDELLVDQNTPLRILDVTMQTDPENNIEYRLVKAEFLNSYIGSHRADYDLQKTKENYLKKQGQEH